MGVGVGLCTHDSSIRPEQFVKEPLRVVVNDVNRSLSELVETKSPNLLEVSGGGTISITCWSFRSSTPTTTLD